MQTSYDLELKNYEAEDIFDVIIKLGESFAIQFPKGAFLKAVTFGDLCDVFHKHINYQHQNTCTSQQAFYKVRDAMAATLDIQQKEITPNTLLEQLFTKENRKKNVRQFQQRLGIKANILKCPDWLMTTIVLTFIGSMIAFFFSWKVALSGLLIFYIGLKIAGWVADEFEPKTVRELVQQLTRENYALLRRNANTYNRNEVTAIITETFSEDLLIDKSNLTETTLLG